MTVFFLYFCRIFDTSPYCPSKNRLPAKKPQTKPIKKKTKQKNKTKRQTCSKAIFFKHVWDTKIVRNITHHHHSPDTYCELQDSLFFKFYAFFSPKQPCQNLVVYSWYWAKWLFLLISEIFFWKELVQPNHKTKNPHLLLVARFW